MVNYIDAKEIRQSLKDIERENKKEIEHMESVRNSIRRNQQAAVSQLTEKKKKLELRFKQIDDGLLDENEDESLHEGGLQQVVIYGAVTLNQPLPISLGVKAMNKDSDGDKKNISSYSSDDVLIEMRAGGFDFVGASRYSHLRLKNELSFRPMKREGISFFF